MKWHQLAWHRVFNEELWQKSVFPQVSLLASLTLSAYSCLGLLPVSFAIPLVSAMLNEKREVGYLSPVFVFERMIGCFSSLLVIALSCSVLPCVVNDFPQGAAKVFFWGWCFFAVFWVPGSAPETCLVYTMLGVNCWSTCWLFRDGLSGYRFSCWKGLKVAWERLGLAISSNICRNGFCGLQFSIMQVVLTLRLELAIVNVLNSNCRLCNCWCLKCLWSCIWSAWNLSRGNVVQRNCTELI